MAITEYKTKKGIRYIADLYMDGKKASRKRGFLTKKAAKLWIEDERRRLSQPIPTRLMFSQIANPYLTYSQKHHSKNTFGYKRATCSNLVHYVQRLFPPATKQEAFLFFPVDILTPAFCDEYLNHLHESKGAKFANRELREINSIFKWAIRKGVIAQNPFATAEPFPTTEFVRHIPTQEEVMKARKTCTPEERDLFDFFFYTAARPISLFRLKWNDIDFKKDSVRLWIQKRKGGNLECYSLSMPTGLRRMLLARWQNRMPDCEHVFHNERGDQLHRNSRVFKYMFKRICKEANVPLFTVTGLRAFLASTADDAGQGLRDIQSQFGHKRQSTTEVYIQKLRVARGIADIIEDLDTQMEDESQLKSVVKME